MKVAINCWVLRNKQLDGLGYFTVNTIPKLIKAHPDVHFQILVPKNYTEDYFGFKNVSVYRIFPSLRHPLLYFFYMEFPVRRFLKKYKPDMFVSIDGFLSLSSKANQISIIHDLNFEHYPKDLKLRNRIYFRLFFRSFAKKSKRVATVSEYSKKDIVNLYKISPDKIDNILSGLNSFFTQLSPDKIPEIRNKVSNGKPYFIFVSSICPRKNVTRLLQAFAIFKKKTSSDFKLVLAGRYLWGKDEVAKEYESNSAKSDIIFLGRVSEEELAKVLGAAYALTFVPIFEGFGLPPVEAMHSGVPVLTSNVTSLPEIAGDAAILVNPFDIEEIAEGMKKLYEDKDDLRKTLIEKGFEQEKLFTWDRTATLLWDCIEKAVAEYT